MGGGDSSSSGSINYYPTQSGAMSSAQSDLTIPWYQSPAFGQALGQGVQGAGRSIAAGSPMPPNANISYQQQPLVVPNQQQSALIPTNQSPEQQIMAILQQILGSSGGT